MYETNWKNRLMNLHAIQLRVDELLEALTHKRDLETWMSECEKLLGNPMVIRSGENQLLMRNATRALLRDNVLEDLLRYLYRGGAPPIVLVDNEELTFDLLFLEYAAPGGIHILLFHCNKKDHKLDLLALKEIGWIIAMELKNMAAAENLRSRNEDTFLQDWLMRRFTRDTDILFTARTHGYPFNIHTEYRVAVLKNGDNTSGLLREMEFNIIKQVLQHVCHHIMFTTHAGKLAMLLDSSQSITELCVAIDRARGITGIDDICLCLSRPQRTAGVPHAYQEAKRISDVANRCSMHLPVITSEHLGVLSILSLLPDNEAVTAYRDKFLTPVKEYDAAHNTQLLNTLRIYLGHNGNIMRTAKTLYTHYNTIAYRLDRVKKILQLDIGDNDIQLQIHVALCLDLLKG